MSVDPGPRRNYGKNDCSGPPRTQKVSGPLTQNSFALEDPGCKIVFASSKEPINLGLCHAKSLMRTESKSFLCRHKSCLCFGSSAADPILPSITPILLSLPLKYCCSKLTTGLSLTLHFPLSIRNQPYDRELMLCDSSWGVKKLSHFNFINISWGLCIAFLCTRK